MEEKTEKRQHSSLWFPGGWWQSKSKRNHSLDILILLNCRFSQKVHYEKHSVRDIQQNQLFFEPKI